jgi:quinol monooxygenase YgiN
MTKLQAASMESVIAPPIPLRRQILQAVVASPVLAIAANQAEAAASHAGALVVIAEIEAKPEHADALRGIMLPFAAASRKEPGCHHYTLLEDPKTPGVFFTYEIWTDQAALAAHMQGANAKAAGPKLAALLAKPPTQSLLGIVSNS